MALSGLVALAAVTGCSDDSKKEDSDANAGAAGSATASGGQDVALDDDDEAPTNAEGGTESQGGAGGTDGRATPETPASAGDDNAAEPPAGDDDDDTPAAGGGGGDSDTEDDDDPVPTGEGGAGADGDGESTGGTPPVPSSCQTGSECPATMECFAGKCAVPLECGNTLDCEPPLVCGGAGRCVECVSEAECGEGQACVGFACRNECDSDNDCRDAGLLCNAPGEESRHCVECLADADCADGRECHGGRCRATETTPTSGTAGAGGAGGSGGEPPEGEGGAPPVEVDAETPAACGDGVVDTGEDCDDGNTASNDGCSADCAYEEGFDCTDQPIDGRFKIRAIYRDFSEDHADFEPSSSGISEATTGLVGSGLDEEGKPVFAADAGAGLISGSESFSEWYRDVDGVNTSYETTLTLWDDGEGAFVNRYYKNGSPWLQTRDEWCGSTGQEEDGQECTFAQGDVPCETNRESMIECVVEEGGAYTGVFLVAEHDGNPLFFPLDGVPDMITPAEELQPAMLPPYYGGWGDDPSGTLHNFHFTSEMTFEFEAGKSERQELRLVGDDDVWVFVNGVLALDMGGTHTPVSGVLEIQQNGTARSGAISADSDQEPSMSDVDLGLESGKRYEVKIFQAERQTTASTFFLSLKGFAVGTTVCSGD